MELSKSMIDALFDFGIYNHQTDVIIAMYKLVFPEWDTILKVDGWPTLHKDTNEYIFRKFMRFDREFHPKVISGGLWLNNGFSSLESERLGVKEWEVDRTEVEVIYDMRMRELNSPSL